MSKELAAEIAKKFIQRRDVFAEQSSNGAWHPVRTDLRDTNSPTVPFKMPHLLSHLEREKSYGHYLLDTDNQTRLFAFDIDFEKNDTRPGYEHVGRWVDVPSTAEQWETSASNGDTWPVFEFDAREAWRSRNHPSRNFCKAQLRHLSDVIAATAIRELDLPVAIAYSGFKGIHVYCFTGPVGASEAREGASIVMSALGQFELARGNHLWKSIDRDPYTGYPNLSIEVFPKQDSISGSDGFGNLMRLPLGRNMKSNDPCFFVDSQAPYDELIPVSDPLGYLLSGNPWKI